MLCNSITSSVVVVAAAAAAASLFERRQELLNFRHDPRNGIAKTQFLVWLMLQPGRGGAPTLHNDLARDSREIPASLLARSARACQNPPIACMYVCMY